MRGAIPPLPQYAFMAWYLAKHRDNFTFTFLYLYHFSLHYGNFNGTLAVGYLLIFSSDSLVVKSVDIMIEILVVQEVKEK
jgi:hypothetical protein